MGMHSGRAYNFQQLTLTCNASYGRDCSTIVPPLTTDYRQQQQIISTVDNIKFNLIRIRWHRKQILPSVFILGCIMSLLVYYGYTSGLNGPQNTHNRLGWT